MKKDDLAIMEFVLDKKKKLAKYNNNMMTIIDGGHGETLDTSKYKSFSKYSRISYLNYAGNTNTSRGTVVRTVASVSGDDLNVRIKYSNGKYLF